MTGFVDASAISGRVSENNLPLTAPTAWSTGGGGGGNNGTTTLTFGAFPGATDASVVVTGQAGILAGSIVRATLRLAATADHTADEHWVEEMDVYAGNIVAATGFTIYARTRNRRLSGSWSVAWNWT